MLYTARDVHKDTVYFTIMPCRITNICSRGRVLIGFYGMWLHLMIITQIAATRLFRWLKFVYGGVSLSSNLPEFDKNKRYIFISNHRSKLDAPVIFSSIPLCTLRRVAPMKFMTAASIYHSVQRPILASCGCYPHKIPGVDIIDYSAEQMARGCNLMIFPEGMRVTRSQSDPKSGVIRLLSRTKSYHPIIILVRVEWRRQGWRRYATVTFAEVPPSLNTQNAHAIMEAIYRL